ncbi:C10 family peptidase [Alistipes sp.]|uniref:C10 family peptidase n=1 Tax=Alistipes sp. TaxID=1872444 RepID=UPI003AB751BD
MKQLRLFLLLAAGLFLTSCSEPQPDEFPNPDPPPTVGRHAVPIDQALGELHDLLGVIDGQGTRAGGVRTIAQVQTLHAQALALTRSASEPGEQPEELLYVVNFEDDAGYAVLGADDRLPGVLAVTDEGSLTTEELVRAANGQTTPEEFTFPNEMLMNYVSGIGGIGGGGIGGGGIGGGGGIPTGPFTDFGTHVGPNIDVGKYIGYTYGDWTVTEYVAPMTVTKWNQSHPYNYTCPTIDGTVLYNSQHCPAGCVAIAIAQIMASNHMHHQVTPGDVARARIDWTKITRAITNPDLTDPDVIVFPDISPEAAEVAYLIGVIGVKIGMEYGPSRSSAYDDDAEAFFKYLGYKGVDLHTFRSKYVRNMLWERKRPAYVSASGYNIFNYNKGGHAWVADGWMYRSRIRYATYDSGFKRQEGTDDQLLMHCNFGWGGMCDGYYFFGAFDTVHDPVAREEDDTDPNHHQYLFDIDPQIITYTEMY